MKRFKYSLQRVLDVREVALNQCEALLAESKRALHARQAEQRQCGDALRQASEAIVKNPSSVHPARECLEERAWFQHLADRLQRAGQAAQKAVVAVDHRRANLKKALMDHKVIENLSRRERCTWLEQLRHAEQKSMDEVAAQTRERHRLAGHSGSHSFPNPARTP